MPAVWGRVPAGDTVGALEDPSGRGGHDTETLPGRCSSRPEGQAAPLTLTARVVLTARLLSLPERKLCSKLFFLEHAVA